MHRGRQRVHLCAIVAATLGVCCGQDGGTRIERRLNTSLGNRDRLLPHGLVDGHLVAGVLTVCANMEQ